LLSDLRVHARLREERRARVAQRVERQPSRQRPQPESMTVPGAPPLRVVRRALDVAAAGLPAPMLVPLDDAGAAERAAKYCGDVEVEAPLCTVGLREKPFRGRPANGR